MHSAVEGRAPCLHTPNKVYQWGRTDLRGTAGQDAIWVFNSLVLKCLWDHWVWWHASVYPALRAQRQGDNSKFETRLGYTGGPWFKIQNRLNEAKCGWALKWICLVRSWIIWDSGPLENRMEEKAWNEEAKGISFMDQHSSGWKIRVITYWDCCGHQPRPFIGGFQ